MTPPLPHHCTWDSSDFVEFISGKFLILGLLFHVTYMMNSIQSIKVFKNK